MSDTKWYQNLFLPQICVHFITLWKQSEKRKIWENQKWSYKMCRIVMRLVVCTIRHNCAPHKWLICMLKIYVIIMYATFYNLNFWGFAILKKTAQYISEANTEIRTLYCVAWEKPRKNDIFNFFIPKTVLVTKLPQ